MGTAGEVKGRERRGWDGINYKIIMTVLALHNGGVTSGQANSSATSAPLFLSISSCYYCTYTTTLNLNIAIPLRPSSAPNSPVMEMEMANDIFWSQTQLFFRVSPPIICMKNWKPDHPVIPVLLCLPILSYFC